MRLYRIKHIADTIGYCYASSAAKAIEAFRAKHKIPQEINITAARAG